MAKSDLDKNLDELIKNMKGFCRVGARAKNKGNVPFGHFGLDFALSYGFDPSAVDLDQIEGYDPAKALGLPLGYLVEIYGNEGGGKSSLAHRIVGSAQKMGLVPAWIDTEHSYREELAEINGVDVDKVIFSEGFSETEDKNYFAEDIMDKIVEWCKSDIIKVVVLDSVANLVPKYRDEHDASKQTVALLPRLLAEQLGRISHYAAKHNVLIILINQLREKPGVSFGNPETSPGGRSLKHNASVRLKVTIRKAAKESIFAGDEIVGKYSGVQIEKNRFARPFIDKEGRYITLGVPVYYKQYFPNISQHLFDVGRQMKLIAVRENLYTWKECKKLTYEDFIKALDDKPTLFNEMLSEVKGQATEKEVILPPEILLQDPKAVDEPKKAKDNGGRKEKVGKPVGRPRKAKDS